MKRLTLIASTLALLIALVLAVGYIQTAQAWQLVVAVVSLIVSVTMFMRHKRLRAPAAAEQAST